MHLLLYNYLLRTRNFTVTGHAPCASTIMKFYYKQWVLRNIWVNTKYSISCLVDERIFLLARSKFSTVLWLNLVPFIWFEPSRVFKMSVFIIYSICNHKLFYIWLGYSVRIYTNTHQQTTAMLQCAWERECTRNRKQFIRFKVCTMHIAFSLLNYFQLNKTNSWSGMIFVDTLNRSGGGGGNGVGNNKTTCNLEGVFCVCMFHVLNGAALCESYKNPNAVDLCNCWSNFSSKMTKMTNGN